MNDSNNSKHPVDLTGPDEPEKKVPKFRADMPEDNMPIDDEELCMAGAFLDV